MVKRKRVFSASNTEEKPDNGLSFEGQIAEKKASNQCKMGGGGRSTDDGIEINTRGGTPCGPAELQAPIVDAVRPTSSAKQSKQTGICEVAALDSQIVEGESDDVGSRRTCTASGLTLRSSVRTQKRTRRDSSPSIVANSAASKKQEIVSVQPSVTPEKVKTRRAWELWSVDDKNMFFEALCEYGKDFEKIKNFVMQKNRKKGQPPQMIKNKDQVRHFYYRTWHKISKHLAISDDVKKQTQELYGLINYGELRKKIRGRLDEKNGQKLNELVHKGATTIRCKGKNLRVKTPLCNALKRLNDVEDLKEEESQRLPARITVEFRPRHNHSWSRVQSFSQNPRIRMNVNLQRRVNTVIGYLQRRWREPTAMQRKEVLKSLDQDRNHCEVEPCLRIMPRQDASINTMSLKTGAAISSSSVSLQNYRRKVHCLGDFSMTTTAVSNCVPNSNCKKGLKAKGKLSTDESKKTVSVEEKSEDVRADEKKLSLENDVSKAESAASHELTLRQLLALETAVIDPVSKTDEVFFARTPSFLCETTPIADANVITAAECAGIISTAAIAEVETNDDIADVSTIDVEAVRRGWTSRDCGTLTFGEVYLLLGSPAKLILDYEWEYPVVGDISFKESQTPIGAQATVTKLTTIMSRLLLIASTTFSDLGRSKQERQGMVQGTTCRCGHSCPLSTKSTSSKTSNAVRSLSISRGTLKTQKSNAVKVSSPAGTDATNLTRTTLPPPSTNETISNAIPPVDVFRRPTLTPVQSRITNAKLFGTSPAAGNLSTSEKAFKEHLHKILPQHRKSKGRMSKSMVVQRELPLLPKAGPTHSMMTLRIIPSASSELAGSFMPVLSSNTTSSQLHPSLTRVVQLAPNSIAPTVGTLVTSPLTDLKASSAPVITSNPTVNLAALPLPNSSLGSQALVSGIHPISTIAGSPCAILISNGSVHLATTVTATVTTTALSIAASSRPSFANRLTTSTTSFPVSTTSVSSALSGLRSVSDLALDTDCSSSAPLSTSESFSSIPVMSISESSIRSNLSISPPTISSLLDISLTGTDMIPMVDGVNMGSDGSNDKLLDLTLGSSNSFSGLIDLTIVGSAGKICGNESVSLTIPSDIGLDHRPSTPIHSPTNSLFKFSSPGLEGHWLNGDVSEFSLSNLLSHLDSPVKVSASLSSSGSHPETLDTMNRLASDMDSQLQCLISESSVDYIAKFEDLAAQISISDAPKKM